VKREVLLAIAVGCVAGLVGALTAPSQAPAPTEVPQADAPSAAANAPQEGFELPPTSRRAEPMAPRVLTVRLTPAAEREVQLSRWSDGTRAWAELPSLRTGADGTARVDLVPGTYWVACGSTAKVVDFAGTAEVELVLEPGVRVSGRVLEAGTRRPLSGVAVTARPNLSGLRGPEAQAVQALTDAFGRFALDELPHGTVHLEALASGHRPRELDVTGKTADPVELMLEPSCRVSGRVVDERGAVEGASVFEVSDDRPVLSDAQGRFTLDVDCTKAQLAARDLSGRFATAKAQGGDVTLTLGPGALLRGVVRMKGGAPVAAADVWAATGDEQLRGRTVSDAQGLFVIGPLAAGSYIVHARKGRGASGAVYGVEHPTEKDVQLALDDAAALTGRVLSDGRPVANADVKLSYPPLRNERPAFTRTDALGEFRLDDLQEGAAIVTATADDGTASADQKLYLNASAAQSVTLVLAAHGRIVGTVMGPGAAGAQVGAFSARDGPEVRRTNAGDDGAFVLVVPVGEYFVNANSMTTRSSTPFRQDHPLRVTAGQDTRVDVELVTDPGSVWGDMASVTRGEVGASFENVSGSVQLSWLVSDSPASRAGLKVGDLVTAINGEPVRDALDTFARTRGTPGGSINITYRRDGSERTVAVTLAK
jgi:hypothetical protein